MLAKYEGPHFLDTLALKHCVVALNFKIRNNLMHVHYCESNTDNIKTKWFQLKLRYFAMQPYFFNAGILTKNAGFYHLLTK